MGKTRTDPPEHHRLALHSSREGGGRNELQVLLLALRFGQTLREWNESQREDEEEGTRGKQTSRKETTLILLKQKFTFSFHPGRNREAKQE
jgi:hypothetical protein